MFKSFALNGGEFMTTVKSSITEEDFNKATEQGARLLARGPLATSVRYSLGRIHVELDNGCAFAFPASHAQMLSGAKVADLRQIEINAAGLGLHWPSLDADLWLPSLIKGVLGTKQWMAQIGASRSVAVHVLGKLKTTVQMVAIPFLLFDGQLLGVIDTALWGTALIWIAGVLTVWSMVYYLQKAWPDILDHAK